MSREQLMGALRERGVDGPERLTRELSDEAISGAIKGYDHKRFTLGRNVNSGLLARMLMDGGLEGFDPEPAKAAAAWWQTSNGRLRWLEQNEEALRFGDDHEWMEYSETAIISLRQQKREPTVETVRSLALQAKQQQDAHDEACKQVKPHDSRFFEKARTSREIAKQMVEEEREGEAA